MNQGKPSRRGSHVEMPLAYAAVGASKLPDLVRFPPTGSTPYEESVRLGSGQPRFLTASNLLMTWAAQRGAGVAVEELRSESPSQGAEDYAGPEFASDGTPLAPKDREEHFAPDGSPYVAAGTRARVTLPGGNPREVLVIYTIIEPRSAGFAWGTADVEGAVGEQLFIVEHREDDSVWAVGRGFLEAPKAGLFGFKGKHAVQFAIDSVTSQLQALLPGATPDPASSSDPGGQSVTDPGSSPEVS